MRLPFNHSYWLCRPLNPYCIFLGGPSLNSQSSYTYLRSWVSLELYNNLFINYISDEIVTPDTSVKYNTQTHTLTQTHTVTSDLQIKRNLKINAAHSVCARTRTQTHKSVQTAVTLHIAGLMRCSHERNTCSSKLVKKIKQLYLISECVSASEEEQDGDRCPWRLQAGEPGEVQRCTMADDRADLQSSPGPRNL